MTEREDKDALGAAVSPEGLVFLMIGVVVGALAAALSFTLGRRSS